MYQIPRLTVWLVLLCILTVKCMASCWNETCTCCKSGSCTSEHVCMGCKDGYFGEKCQEPCPHNCYNCSQIYFEDGKCYTCNNGYYIGRPSNLTEHPMVYDCSLSCQDGCDFCDSYFNCTRCKREYFKSVRNECLKCQDNCEECSSATDCEICKDHYFKDVDRCQQCKPNCKVCNNYTACRDCDKGFYLKGNDCRRCQKECLLCSDIDTCYHCKIGFSLLGKQCLSENVSSIGTGGTSVSTSGTNTGLIVGLPVGLIIIILICVIYQKKKQRRKDRSGLHDDYNTSDGNITEAEGEEGNEGVRNDESSLIGNTDHRDTINSVFITFQEKEGSKCYFASSGPAVMLKRNPGEFWRHIFQKGHGKIVVLSNLANRQEKKTDAYLSYNETFGDLSVTSGTDKEVFPSYRVRTVTMKTETHQKDIELFHFHAWPHGKTPTNIEQFFEFHKKVNDFKVAVYGPTLVYCSDGIERSATYIAFDFLKRKAKTLTKDDVLNCWNNLKKNEAEANIDHINQLVFHEEPGMLETFRSKVEELTQ